MPSLYSYILLCSVVVPWIKLFFTLTLLHTFVLINNLDSFILCVLSLPACLNGLFSLHGHIQGFNLLISICKTTHLTNRWETGKSWEKTFIFFKVFYSMIAFILLERPFYSFCICMAVRVCKGLLEPNIYYHSDCTCGPHMLTKVHEYVHLCINHLSYKQNIHLLAFYCFGALSIP